jgi:hypothetical protein
MSYLNKILGGNIPLSVVQTIGGNKKNYKLKQDFSYYQIKEGMEDVSMSNDINDIMNTQYGSLITKSVELNRDKVLEGSRTLIHNSLRVAVESNSNELLKITESVDSKQYASIILGVTQTFSEKFLTEIKALNLNYDLFSLHIKLVYLSGLTGESAKSIDDISKKLALELELGKNFKVESYIDINQTFVDIIKPSNIRSCGQRISFPCLFNEIFISKLSLSILNIWETILESIMSSLKYEKLISLYAFSVAFSDEIYKLKNSNLRITETFLDAGNSTKISDTSKIKDLKTIEKNIDQSKVIKGMTAMVSSAVTNAVSKNSADLLRSIAASNRISVGSASGSSFTLTQIKQTNTIEQETNANFVQQVTNKVINDIGSKLQENIDAAAKQAASDTKKLTSDEKSGTSIGGMLDSVANVAGKAIDGLASVVQISAGNSVDQSTTKDITQEMKDLFKLDQSFKYEKNDEVKNSLENILSTENLAKCAADTKAENAIDISSISVSGPIVISELDQTNVVKDVMNCAFNQTVMNDISNKILNDYNKIIKQMVENVDTKLDEQTKSNVQGDIYAAGVAGAAVLQAAGEGLSTAAQGAGEGLSTAAQGAGEGLSTAAQGAGEGLSTAAKGVGEGVGDVMSGLALPLTIGGIILVILIVGYVIFKSMGGIKKKDFVGDD